VFVKQGVKGVHCGPLEHHRTFARREGVTCRTLERLWICHPVSLSVGKFPLHERNLHRGIRNLSCSDRVGETRGCLFGSKGDTLPAGVLLEGEGVTPSEMYSRNVTLFPHQRRRAERLRKPKKLGPSSDGFRRGGVRDNYQQGSNPQAPHQSIFDTVGSLSLPRMRHADRYHFKVYLA